MGGGSFLLTASLVKGNLTSVCENQRRRHNLPSGHDPIMAGTGTPYLKLSQPLDRCVVSAGYGCSGGHEEYAGQQGQDEDEPLGVHRRKSSGVEVGRLRARGGGGLGVSFPWVSFLYLPKTTTSPIPLAGLSQIVCSLIWFQKPVMMRCERWAALVAGF